MEYLNNPLLIIISIILVLILAFVGLLGFIVKNSNPWGYYRRLRKQNLYESIVFKALSNTGLKYAFPFTPVPDVNNKQEYLWNVNHFNKILQTNVEPSNILLLDIIRMRKQLQKVLNKHANLKVDASIVGHMLQEMNNSPKNPTPFTVIQIVEFMNIRADLAKIMHLHKNGLSYNQIKEYHTLPIEWVLTINN